MNASQKQSLNLGGLVKSSEIVRDKQVNKKIPKEAWCKIHALHEYVASIFVGCSMPPLDQFLQLQIQEDSCKVKLQKYSKDFITKQQSTRYLYYLDSGKMYLRKNNLQDDKQKLRSSHTTQRIISASSISSSKLAKKQPNPKQKAIQVKQNSFFMLCNIRKNTQIQSLQIQNFDNGQYNCCLVGKIKINQKFGLDWYISESSKHLFLGSLFQNQSYDISEHKLKGLSRFFKYDQFRRGTFLSIQNQQSQRLFIIKSGECQYSKSFSFDEKNHENFKTIKVANGESRAVIGAQFLLFNFQGSSKSVTTAAKAMSELKNQIPRLNFQIYYQDKNNFTVTVVSAFAQIFYISVAKFKQLCQKYVPQVPQNIRRNIQGNYITLLRTTKQKLDLQLIKIERNQNKVNQQKVLIQSKLRTGQYDIDPQSPDKQQYKTHSPLRIKKSQFIQTNLLEKQVEKNRNKRLQKKIQLILQANKTSVNYKKKIEIVLKQKLSQSRMTESPVLNSKDNDKYQSPSQIQKMQMAKDFNQIFADIENKYSTNNIQKQTEIVNKKQSLFKKRYSSVNNCLIVHQQCYDKQKNKLFRMDLLRRGVVDPQDKPQTNRNRLSMKSLSQKIKKQCLQKINRANKIKQQFMTIRSECQHCHCYDDIQSYVGNNSSHKDIKTQMMKTGLAWRPQSQNKNYQQPLQKLHSRTKLISQKAARKYQHNIHLHQKKKRFVSSQRRLSAPIY